MLCKLFYHSCVHKIATAVVSNAAAIQKRQPLQPTGRESVSTHNIFLCETVFQFSDTRLPGGLILTQATI